MTVPHPSAVATLVHMRRQQYIDRTAFMQLSACLPCNHLKASEAVLLCPHRLCHTASQKLGGLTVAVCHASPVQAPTRHEWST